MSEQKGLSRQSFLFLAGAAGLKTEDPHMEELYTYLQEILPKLKGAAEPPPAGDKELDTYIRRYMPTLRRLEEIELAGLDPAMVYRPLSGGGDE